MRKHIRNLVARVPLFISAFRILRDELILHRSRPYPTPFGFLIRGHRIMQSGKYEPEVTSLIRSFLPSSDVFVDVGANIGFYSCLARSMNKQVIAIEPLNQNLRFLYENLKINNWSDVEVFPIGLDAHPGIRTLYGLSTGASLIENWAQAGSAYQTTIAVSSMDNLLGNRFEGKRLVLKIDVEGGELPIIEGASRILSMSPRPVWIVEICLTEHHPGGLNPRFRRTFELFWRQGYKAWTVESERNLVLPTDINRWVDGGHRDFGTPNFCFMDDNY